MIEASPLGLPTGFFFSKRALGGRPFLFNTTSLLGVLGVVN